MNRIEFTISLNDLGSTALARFVNTGNSVFGKMTTGLGGVQKQIAQTAYQLSAFSKPVVLSINTSAIQQASDQVDQLQSKMLSLSNGGGNILNIDRWQSGGGGWFNRGQRGNGGGGGRNNNSDDNSGSKGGFNWFGLGGFARQALGMAGIGGGAYLAKDVLSEGMERQLNQISLETLLGQKQGDTVNDQLLKFAKDSIYGKEVFNEGKLLGGSGVKAGNILPIEKMFGDIAGGDKERMKTYALAFSEANSTGHLTGRQQMMFRTALFNPLEQLSDMTHKSVPQLEKDMEKGKISINDLVKAMQHATGEGGRWHDMMQKMQNTPAGKWTAFTGTVSTLAGTIGLKLLPALGNTADFLTDLANDTAKLKDFAVGIGAMTGAWMLYTAWTKKAAIETAAIEIAAYWPLVAVGVLAGAYADLQKYNIDYAKSTDSVAKASEGFAGRTFTVWEKLRWSMQDIFYGIEVGILGLESAFERIWKADSLALHGHPIDAIKSFITGETDGDKKLSALKRDHQWAVINREAGTGSPNDPLANMFSKYTPGKAIGDAGLGDTTKGITGGGVRNIYINVAKFQDKTEIHTTNLREGVEQVEEVLRDMFLRITNSGATALSN